MDMTMDTLMYGLMNFVSGSYKFKQLYKDSSKMNGKTMNMFIYILKHVYTG